MFELQPTRASIKSRFYIWLVVSLVFLVLFSKLFFSGFSLNSNILDLLPTSQANPIAEQASNRFTSTISKQLVFLVANKDQAQAEQAATVFYNHINKSVLLDEINYRVSDSEQQAWASFYYPYRLSLLSQQQQQWFLDNDIAKFKSNALFNLYNPIGISSSALLTNDPWYLFQSFLTSLPKPTATLNLIQQQLMTHYQNQWYVLITAQAKDDGFSISNQNKLTGLINSAITLTQQTIPHTDILKTGMLFYAKAGAQDAQQDISTIGVASILGIILLMLWVFRSIKPLIMTLFSTAIGFIAAFVITQLFFAQIYLFTLVFGASLIGICVDYAFFYYAEQINGGKSWTAMTGLKAIFPGISLGLLNVLLAYGVIMFTPFPGLKQLAVFSVTGLIMAYATVVCLFPLILKPRAKPLTPQLMRASTAYLRLWHDLKKKNIVIIYLLIGIFSVIGLSMLHSNDDVRALENMPSNLKHQENQIKTIIGTNIGTRFYIVEGNTAQQTLTHEHQLTQALKKQLPNINKPYLSMSDYLPTIAEQQHNYKNIQQYLIHQNLSGYLRDIGVTDTQSKKIQNNLSTLLFKPLTINDWLSSPSSKSLRYLWLGKIDNKFISVVLLNKNITDEQAQKVSQSFTFATYVNKTAEVSGVFKYYREQISLFLIFIYVVLFIVLWLRYSSKKVLYYFLPPLGATSLTLSCLGWLGISLNLFNLLALILVLGISIDYVLFLAETRNRYQNTMLAITLSAITMGLSFGLLALSKTPVIHDFGITILLGIVSAYLLSPLAICAKPQETL